ncbi:3870_t:CDS:2 [Ambispora gerdemannii]|uniref:3870_t:CDS:1 n=1 Tax=Ambispora gerdemannii TaxID=144530 RepID=A0A9N9CZI5_9GLOM|nr:3870_t:CDS:2 [Ambispora gerdemannii]
MRQCSTIIALIGDQTITQRQSLNHESTSVPFHGFGSDSARQDYVLPLLFYNAGSDSARNYAVKEGEPTSDLIYSDFEMQQYKTFLELFSGVGSDPAVNYVMQEHESTLDPDLANQHQIFWNSFHESKDS